VEIVEVQTPDRGPLQLQQMRLTRIDVDRKNAPRIFEEQTERIASARTDGDKRIAWSDLKSLPIRLGVLPAHSEKQLGKFDLTRLSSAHR
jgi:hypothetical protein